MIRWILSVSLMVSAAGVFAQPQDRNVDALETSITTDKASYAEGEPIEIRITIANPTDSSAVKEFLVGCSTSFTLNGLSPDFYCGAAAFPVIFPAYSALTVVWRMEPIDMGWPTRSGQHLLVGYGMGEPGMTTFEAPAATGGRVIFLTVPGLTLDDLAPLRNSLNAEVLGESEGAGGAFGEWRIRGEQPLDTLVAQYELDARFQRFEANREMYPVESFFTADEYASPGLGLQIVAFPNPVSETLELAISTPQPQEATLEVFDALGRRTYRDTNWRGDSRQLDVSQWPPGLYTVRVSTRDASSMQRVTVVR